MKTDILRQKFLDYFKSKKHKVVESDSLAPKDDPTVLFTPAGMNQFKKEFMGFDSGFKRAASSQRCLRTDDLDKVGKTRGHHTFFEMLGNFSFGDYFKKEAINYAWEFLTQELKISKGKLWVSVYKDDDEAYGIWKESIKVPVEKIVKLGDKSNFWPSEAKEKGPNGPCGPCSEIFFDQGEDVGCRKPNCSPACDCGRFLEVWNLVFTQYNRLEGGKLEPLPNKNIDTGMGLERLAAVMQGAANNFETDLFEPLIREIVSGIKTKAVNQKELVYAISDHLRAITFCIYDGVLPSNEARGYVVRKLIRKSSLHLKALGFSGPFIYKLVPVLAQIMQGYYPELKSRQEGISEIILSEEKTFIATLNSSDTILKERFKGPNAKLDAQAVGRIAFSLYDTYGMPLELTRDWLERNRISFSQEAYDKEMNQQKTRSKIQSAMKGDVFSSKDLDYGVKETQFLGYTMGSSKVKILKIFCENSEAKKIGPGQEARIILEKTPFYGESGGQVGDTGTFTKGKNTFVVENTVKAGKVTIHLGKVKNGTFKKNDLVSTQIDSSRRLAIARNHTATHLLQAALRKVLGGHVRQQGSLVSDDKFRFDFTHFKDISKEQLDSIEEVLNDFVMANIPLDTKQLTLTQAKKAGALAFFGEKYDSKVRVVSVKDVSREFCGGTHLKSTGSIGFLKIISEGSVASGVRRIEGVTGKRAYNFIKEKEGMLNEAARLLNVEEVKIIPELQKRSLRIKELEKACTLQKVDSLKNAVEGLLQNAIEVKDVKIISTLIADADMDLLRKNVDILKERSPARSVFILGSSSQGRAILVAGVTPDLCDKLDAGQMVRSVAGILGGNGGGRKDFAQAGGNQPRNLEEALAKIKADVEKLL